MSGLSKSDRDYWANYLRSKVDEKLQEFLKDKKEEREEISRELINKIFEELKIPATLVEALRANHERQEEAHKELDRLEEESIDLAKQISGPLMERYSRSRYNYRSAWNDFYPTLLRSMKEDTNRETAKTLSDRYPYIESLEKLREDIPVQIMWATSANSLKEIVGQLLERLGIVM